MTGNEKLLLVIQCSFFLDYKKKRTKKELAA